jgi:dihydroorotase
VKERPFDQAPPGMLGLETALGVAVTELSKQGDVDWVQLLALLSWQPAAIAGLTEHAGTLVEGRAAHLCVIDPTAVWAVDAAKSASLSRNTPWAGRRLTGRVRHTLLAGEPVVVDGEATR